MDDSSPRMDSDSFLGSMDSDIHLPTLSLHCHCQQLLQEGGGGVGGAGGEGVAGEEGVDEVKKYTLPISLIISDF